MKTVLSLWSNGIGRFIHSIPGPVLGLAHCGQGGPWAPRSDQGPVARAGSGRSGWRRSRESPPRPAYPEAASLGLVGEILSGFLFPAQAEGSCHHAHVSHSWPGDISRNTTAWRVS